MYVHSIGRYQALFAGPRWDVLAGAGAMTQRLLWASTGAKNPAYKDTMYVEALIARDTVDTIPPATMDAFRDHGAANADALGQDLGVAEEVIDALERHGVTLKAVTDGLVIEGVQQFADSFDKLFTAVARQRRVLTEGEQPRFAPFDSAGSAASAATVHRSSATASRMGTGKSGQSSHGFATGRCRATAK